MQKSTFARELRLHQVKGAHFVALDPLTCLTTVLKKRHALKKENIRRGIAIQIVLVRNVWECKDPRSRSQNFRISR